MARGEYSRVLSKLEKDWELKESIVIALLASFPNGTWFESRSYKTNYLTNELDKQINEVLRECDLPIVKKAFQFTWTKYGIRCEDIYWMLSVVLRYGETVGLSNAGLDFDYFVDCKDEKLAKLRKKAVSILGEKVFEQLKELGAKKIKKKN